MPETPDTNAEIWKSAEGISKWMSTADDRERRRAEQRRLLADLMQFDDDETFTFADLGAGTGAAARAVLDRYPGASAILADYSPQMMAEGKKALAPYEGRYRYVEFDLAHSEWPADMPARLAAVISSLSVHHLPDERKQQLFAEISSRLAPGGWYLNYDAVAAGDPAVEAVWQRASDRRDPASAYQRAHRTAEEQRHFENHVRYIIPLDRQTGFLRAAGFESVEVFWKELDYAIYGGRRPVTGT